jgi:hypothetical protein
MRDDELDVLLSSLTSVEPDPRLAGRVMRAIEAAPTPLRVAAWPALAAVGVAVVLVVAAGITWRASRVGPWPQVASAPAPEDHVRGRASASARGFGGPPELQRGRSALQSDDAWGRASALQADDVLPAPPPRRPARAIPEEDPWPYRLPALEPSAPLALDRIERETIGHQELGVEPLSIAQLEIESLER